MNNGSRGTDDAAGAGQEADDDGFSRRGMMAGGAATFTSLSVAGCCDPPATATETPSPTATPTLTVTNQTTTTDEDGTSVDESTPTPTPTPSPTPTGTGACTPASLFMQGQEVGLLVGVYRMDSGKLLGPSEVSSVSVAFDAEAVEPRELAWRGDHESVIEERWGGTLADTDRLEPGTYQYEVTVRTHDGTEETVSDRFELVARA